MKRIQYAGHPPYLMTAVLFLSAFCAAQVESGEPSSLVQPQRSWAEANSLLQKLEDINHRKQTKKPAPPEVISVTEGELNSYLNLTLGPQMPPGLSDLEVHFERDHIAAKAMVDLGQIKGSIPSQNPWSPLSLLSGRVPVELKGRLPNHDSFGSLEIENARLGPMTIPISVLEQFVSSLTQTRENPEGFDIGAPFRLPYSLRRVRIQSGCLYLEF